MFKKGLSFIIVGCFLFSFLVIGVGTSQAKTDLNLFHLLSCYSYPYPIGSRMG